MRFEVKDGGFGYPRGGCIFSHVNFTMDKPEVLSVLGANGAGKTTLLKCMLGLLEWKTGGTYIDGINIKEIPYHQLWQKIGYVPQAKASAFAYHAEDMVHSQTVHKVFYAFCAIYHSRTIHTFCTFHTFCALHHAPLSITSFNPTGRTHV